MCVINCLVILPGARPASLARNEGKKESSPRGVRSSGPRISKDAWGKDPGGKG